MNEHALFRTLLIRLAAGELQGDIASDLTIPSHETFSRMRCQLLARDNLQAVLEALRQEWIFPHEIEIDVVRSQPPKDELDIQVMLKVAEGFERADVVAMMGISNPPGYFRDLFIRLEAPDKLAAVLEAMRRGWFMLSDVEPLCRRENPLTRSESRVLALVLARSRTYEIARALGISEGSVGNHKMRAKAKMGTNTIEEAAHIARQLGYC